MISNFRQNKPPYVDYSELLERTHIQNEITSLLHSFDRECSNINYKKGIYIYGRLEQAKRILL